MILNNLKRNYRLLLTKRNIPIGGRQESTHKVNSDYCLNLVKTNDYENFVGTLLLPKDLVRSALAIRAFNVELANVSVSTREPKIGVMRMRFWKDRIEMIYKNDENFNLTTEPITSELAIAIRRHSLTKQWFMRLISCRENNIKTRNQYQTVQEVEAFGELSVATIYYLLFECLGAKNVNFDHAASHFAKAQILTNLIRSMPMQSQSNVSYIPIELLLKHKVSQHDLIRKKPSSNLNDLIFDMCNLSNQHVSKTRKLLGQIDSRNVRLVFLNLVNIEAFLQRIQKLNFNIFDENLHKRDGYMPMRIFLAKFLKRI
jgi:NADH dehydrogenase [ubiquinone] 1 alpha subcomplex assembly factor 6